MKQGFQTKQCDLQVKDIDHKGRTVLIYVSAFNNKDSDGDIILPGAFKKTIAENGPESSLPRIKHLRQHQTDRIIGKPTKMVEDGKGLLVTSVLANTTEGNDALGLYELDLFEHSIGFRPVKGEPDTETDAYFMREIALREYSSVTWGANEQTPLVGMKSLDKLTQANKLGERMEKLAKALRKGNLTDETFELLELEIEQLKAAYDELLTPLIAEKQPDTTTEKQATEPDPLEILKIFKDSIKLN